MKIILSVILCVLCQTQNQLEVGQKLNKDIKIIDYNQYIMDSSGSIKKGYEILYNHCKFNITFDTGHKVEAIFTNDRKFLTDDSIRVGMLYGDIKQKLVSKMPHIQPGWANYCISQSGWKIAFDYNSIVCDTSKVTFIFKSKNVR